MTKNKLDCIGFVDDGLIEKAEKYAGVTRKNTWVKWGAVAACFCLVAVGAATIMPKFIREAGTGMDGGNQSVAGGVGAGITYSVAVLPEDKSIDDVQSAYCNEIDEAAAHKEAGLSDYLPLRLPEGYHFGQASIYVTTMNDGTIYKKLLVTYRKGEAPGALPNEEGAGVAQSTDDLGEEFRINIFSFRPVASAEVYAVEEIKRELANGAFDSGYFYVQYGDHYVGIEPLSLSAGEILRMIDSIGR